MRPFFTFRAKQQGSGRYFYLREITTLVGGPCNTSTKYVSYRHNLEIPPTANVLPPKNEKPPTAKTIPPYCINAEQYRRILVLPVAPKCTANSRYRQKYQLSIPAKGYRQLSIPPKRYRQQWIPPERYRRHWISPKQYRR